MADPWPQREAAHGAALGSYAGGLSLFPIIDRRRIQGNGAPPRSAV